MNSTTKDLYRLDYIKNGQLHEKNILYKIREQTKAHGNISSAINVNKVILVLIYKDLGKINYIFP